MKQTIEIVIGTRGSPLAVAQAKIVQRDLQSKNPGLQTTISKIATIGDSENMRRDQLSTGKDLFTREIDRALISGDIDMAVHSLKDIPVDISENNSIKIAAFPRRENPSDVLISKRGYTLNSLPINAVIGTSSIRRLIQLRALRDELEIVELHGNVGTRIKKLNSSNMDAIVVAKAGLNRLGQNTLGESIPTSIMLPAVGQGCLAIAVRRNDTKTGRLARTIDHSETRIAVSAERAFSKFLRGGCNTPIAAFATIGHSKINLEGLIERHNQIIRGRISGPIESPFRLGRALANQLNSLSDWR